MIETPHRPLVLYVRDGGGDHDQVCKILREAGHELLEAHSGAQAVELSSERRPHVVVLDLALNDMSIAELIRELRSQPGGQEMALLSITDRKHRPRAFRGLEYGADAYLLRPIDARGLLAQVDALSRMRSAEQRARRFAREWRVAFDAITDAILVLSKEGEVIRCNRAALRLLRRPREQVISLHYLEVFPTARGLPADLTTSRAPTLTEITVGDRFYRLAVDPVVEDVDASAGEVVVVLTDLTEVKRYEEDLRRHAAELEVHNQRQIEFLRLLSHELRNPLAAISAAASTLADAPPSAPRTDRRRRTDDLAPLDVIRRQVGHLTHMVAALLDISRISAGKIDLHLAVHDLRDICRSAVASVRPAAEEAKHSLRLEMDPLPLMSRVDATRFEQVLANLLDNSIKYTPAGGEITVRLRPDPDRTTQAQLSVSDTGMGLPDEAALEDVFEMFVQYERTLARAQGGLGIGLSLARTLVRMHGGTISASSGGAGQGTRMTISMPRVLTSNSLPPEPPLRPTPTPAPVNPFKSRKVLLVEDNEDLRQLVAFRLHRAGHDVRQASSGPEGLKLALESPPDVFVLDIGLPDMDGYELARALRAQKSLAGRFMIALTGYGSEEARQAARAAGFDTHLVKPTNLNKLQALIEQGPEALKKD